MKTVLLLFLIVIITGDIFSQKEAGNWCFGFHTSMTFNTPDGKPVEFPAAQKPVTWSSGGTSCISDAEGGLLFYSDGIRIYDRKNQLMPNGSGLSGDSSCTQSSIVIPAPGNQGKYYLFTTASYRKTMAGDKPGFCYSTVDMSLNNGYGDVVTTEKNIKLMNDCAEKLTALKHANGTDFWVITHAMGNNLFYVFLVTGEGVSLHHTDAVGAAYDNKFFRRGYLKASPPGNKLAAAYCNETFVELFDFDNATGTISGAMRLNHLAYALEFSRCGNKLFIGNNTMVMMYRSFVNEIGQYDLGSDNREDIIKSFVELDYYDGDNGLWGMQLGIDGKIYTSGQGGHSNIVHVIPWPSMRGPTYNDGKYNDEVAITFLDQAVAGRFPNFIQSYFFSEDETHPYTLEIPSIDPICEGDSVKIAPSVQPGFPEGADYYSWTFPGQKKGYYESKFIQAGVPASSSGYYVLTVTLGHRCPPVILKDSVFVQVNKRPETEISGKTDICERQATVLKAAKEKNGDTYEWSTGETGKSITVSSAGEYWLRIVNAAGCDAYDTVSVKVNALPLAAIQGNPVICGGDPALLSVAEVPGEEYEWSTGKKGSMLEVTNAGRYWLKVVSAAGCEAYDTVQVTSAARPAVKISGSLSICDLKPVTLTVQKVKGEEYEWSTGDAGPFALIEKAGEYWVRAVNEAGCESYDTVQVRAGFSPEPEISMKDGLCEAVLSVKPVQGEEYHWSTGETGNSIIIRSAGEYSVRAVNETGCEANAKINADISGLDVDIAGRTSICDGSPISLSVIESENVEYLWSNGETGASIIVSVPGKYSIKAKNKAGCEAYDTVIVTQGRQPDVSIEGNRGFCEGDSTVLSVAQAEGETYVWSTGAEGIAIIALEGGSYWVRAENEAGCIAYDTVEVTVTPLPKTEIEGNLSICGGESVLLSVIPVQGGKYLWSTGATGPSTIVSETGIYWVRAENEAGCVAYDTVEVKAGNKINVEIEGISFFCEGGSTILSVAEGAGMTYEWSTGENGNSIVADAAGTYWIRGSNESGCEDYDTLQVTMRPKPDAMINGEAFICAGEERTLSVVHTEGNTYTWNTGGKENSISVTAPGAYFVEVTDPYGCSATGEFTISMKHSVTVSGDTVHAEIGSGNTVLKIRAEAGEAIPAGKISARISFDKSCFLPDTGQSVITGDLTDGGMRYLDLEKDNVELDPGLSVIFEVRGTALLAPDPEYPVNILSFEAGGGETCIDEAKPGMINIEKVCYQNLRQILLTKSVQISVSPNPSSGMVEISISDGEEGEYSVCLYDMQGRVAGMREEIYVKGGKYGYSHDFGASPNGSYRLTVTTPRGQVISMPLFIMK